MIPIVGKCFACGEPIYNKALPCPKCGYKFDVDDKRTCPNSKFGLCVLNDTLCPHGIRWQTCSLKNKVDNESEF